MDATSTLLVDLAGDDLAHTLVDLHRLVNDSLLAGVRHIVVDASSIDCLSSTTVTALLWAQRRCRTRGGSVVLRNPSARSMDLLVRTGLWDVLEVEAGAPRRSRQALRTSS